MGDLVPVDNVLFSKEKGSEEWKEGVMMVELAGEEGSGVGSRI